MTRTVTIISSDGSEDSDLAFSKLCRFAGLVSETVPVEEARRWWSGVSPKATQSIYCCALSSLTLASLVDAESTEMATRDRILESVDFMYLFDIAPEPRSDRAIGLITNGKVKGATTTRSGPDCYQFSDREQEMLHELSGLRISPSNATSDFKLVVSATSDVVKPIIGIESAPFFAYTKQRRCTVFLVARARPVDIDSRVQGNSDVTCLLSQCLPDLIFLRHVFGQSCWHTDALHANFIIDDPYLRRKYGYLDFGKLAVQVDKVGFAATIAFIPWNYKRTSREVISLFKERSANLSLCVHGCDHTQGEFGTTELNDLNYLVQDATWRMERHTQSTSMPYDRIMVFPQGKFSVEAMRALKCNNFIAAVNSSPFALNNGGSISLRDVLSPAVMRYHSFPLFVRRYPSDLHQKVVIDSFLGKPLLFVEHHGFCVGDCKNIVEVAYKVNSISRRVVWCTLGSAIRHTQQIREEGRRTIQCRVYANTSKLVNRYEEEKTFVVAKEEQDCEAVEAVLVDNNPIDFRWADGFVETEFNTAPAQSVSLQIVYKDCRIGLGRPRTRTSRLRAAVRRHLSDFRDIRLSRSRLLTRIAERLRGT